MGEFSEKPRGTIKTWSRIGKTDFVHFCMFWWHFFTKISLTTFIISNQRLKTSGLWPKLRTFGWYVTCPKLCNFFLGWPPYCAAYSTTLIRRYVRFHDDSIPGKVKISCAINMVLKGWKAEKAIFHQKIAPEILGKTPPKAMEWGWAPPYGKSPQFCDFFAMMTSLMKLSYMSNKQTFEI